MISDTFRLFPHCYLVKGAVRGAIYDLQTGQIYSVNQKSAKFLEMLEQFNIQKASEAVNMDLEKSESFLDEMKNAKLGDYNLEKTIRTQVDFHLSKLEFVHFEVTEHCNLKCIHCYAGGSKKLRRPTLKVRDYENIFMQIRGLGCKSIQFIGGEPFLRAAFLREAALIAKESGFHQIEIFTNGTLVTDEDLNWIRDCGVEIAVSLHGSRPEIHNGVTNDPDSWNKTVGLIKKLLKLEIPVRAGIIIMKQNENDAEEIKSFVQALGVKRYNMDYVRPSGRGCNTDLIIDSICDKQKLYTPRFKNISENDFWKAHFGHSCFLDKVCITSQGDVIPCVMERDIIYGNVRKRPIHDIVMDKNALKFRTLSKHKIDVCKNCEFRFGCFDCRLKARAYEPSNIYAKPWWCGYDPFKGEWKLPEKENA